jgi:hypothetical protein
MSWGRFDIEVTTDDQRTVEVELRNDPVVSPAELGLSADDRQLGIGLERATVVRADTRT